MSAWHVMPVNDLVQHEKNQDCVCVPDLDAEVGNIWIHHSLDGREQSE
jgi:hypothetical protein